MSDQYATIKQHEPLRVPNGWSGQEKRFVAQLEEIFDDLYAKFNRIKMSDLGKSLQDTINAKLTDEITLENGTKTTLTNLLLVTAKGLENKADSEVIGPDGEKTTLSSLLLATAEGLELKASEESVTSLGERVKTNETKIKTAADGITAIVTGTTPVGAVDTTTVQVTKQGFHIGTTGKFTVDSGNFTLDGNGNLSASGAQINGELLNNGQKVLTPLDIYVGSSEPLYPSQGMVWIRPGASEEQTASQTTHTYYYTQGSRLGLSSNPISGYLTGPAAEQAGSNIKYEIDIPVFLGGDVTNATVTIELNGQSFSGTVSGSRYDHRTVHISASKSVWIANTSSIPFILRASTNNVLNNKSDGGYQIVVTSRSSS